MADNTININLNNMHLLAPVVASNLAGVILSELDKIPAEKRTEDAKAKAISSVMKLWSEITHQLYQLPSAPIARPKAGAQQD